MYDPTLIMGVELEVEIEGDPNPEASFVSKNPIFTSGNKALATNYTHTVHGNLVKAIEESCGDEIIVAYDSTLNDGFELIGMPRSIAANKTAWAKLLNNPKIKPYLRGEEVAEGNNARGAFRSAGMHVHLSGDPITPLLLGKMMFFLNATDNKALVTRVAGRTANIFCGTDGTVTVKDALALYHAPGCPKAKTSGRKIKEGGNGYPDVQIEEPTYDRYGVLVGVPRLCCAGAIRRANKRFGRGAFYPTPGRNTGDCEIRIFKSAVNLDRFMVNLEFCQALVDFCQETTLPNLDAKKFTVWMSTLVCRLKYRNLFKYLRADGFATGLIPSRATLSDMIARGRVSEKIRSLGLAA